MPNRLIDCIRRVALLRDGGGLSDGQLLDLFVKHRDGDAFAALLKRHGPMVMGVCRRLLRNQHDAEDAFQAAFLIFVRKAGSVKAEDSLAGWLYRVAYRTALEARARIARRRGKERQMNDVPDPVIETDEGQRELLALLDTELDRLPDKYRVPIVLCVLEGMSRKEAAGTLGLAEGTLSWRLAQAKKMLAKRLARHGLVISGVTLAAAMAPGIASACLRASTAKAALSAGAVPAQVVALTEGVMKAMLLTKLKITVCAATLVLVAGVGATGVAYRAGAEEPQRSGYTAFSTTSAESRPSSDDLEALRLEIEALRKSLRATRERVKTLEGEVSALKGKSGSSTGMRGGVIDGPRLQGMSGMTLNSNRPNRGTGGRTPSNNPYGQLGGAPSNNPLGQQGGQAPNQPQPQGAKPTSNDAFGQGHAGRGTSRPDTAAESSSAQTQAGRRRSPMAGPSADRKPNLPADPVSEAEAALQKLRSNPGDKKAVEALERALKRLKEQEKPKQSTQGESELMK